MRQTVAEIVADGEGVAVDYLMPCEPLPCGHDAVSWYGWKQSSEGLRLEPSLESHVELRCSYCSAVVHDTRKENLRSAPGELPAQEVAAPSEDLGRPPEEKAAIAAWQTKLREGG